MKKFLSLVLALVMTMSLVTISAGAADFGDSNDIDYKEAVDVISALGIVDGYSDGSFRPDGSLTRGAAAKIICNLVLGPTTASALSASTAPFKDVPTTNTFAGYITYCSQQGIISGYGDGTFRPTGSLTGNAFLKMLLGALGYDGSVEGYTGANWQVNVVKQAVGIGLDDGNDDFVGSRTVTRQEAALYAFNTLQATMVEYDTKSAIVVGDVTINTVPARSDMANNAANQTIKQDNKMQFGERYFDNLRLTTVSDDFGRPSNKWTVKNVAVGTYPKAADYVYTAAASGDTAADKVKNMGLKGFDVDAASYEINGDSKTLSGSDNAKLEAIAGLTANGTQVLVYLDDDKAETIDNVVVMETQLMQINTVKSGTVTLKKVDDSQDGDTTNVPFKTVAAVEEGDDVFATLSGMKADDYVLVVPVRDGSTYKAAYVAVPEVVTGSLDKITTKSGNTKVSGITVADNTYSMSSLWTSKDGQLNKDTKLTNTGDVTVYLDTYGYAIYATNVESSNDVIIIDEIYSSLVNGKIVKMAQGWDINGNALQLNLGTNPTLPDSQSDVTIQGQTYEYTTSDANGADFRLVKHGTTVTTDTSKELVYAPSAAATIKNGAYNAKVDASNSLPFADDVKTIFLSKDSSDVTGITVVEGVTEVGDSNATPKREYNLTYVLNNDRDEIVAVVVPDDTDAANTANLLYLQKIEGYRTNADGDRVPVFTAWINGEKVEGCEYNKTGTPAANTFYTYTEKDGVYGLTKYDRQGRATSTWTGDELVKADVISGSYFTSASAGVLNAKDAVVIDLYTDDGVDYSSLKEMYDAMNAETNPVTKFTVSYIYNGSDNKDANKVSYLFITGTVGGGNGQQGGGQGDAGDFAYDVLVSKNGNATIRISDYKWPTDKQYKSTTLTFNLVDANNAIASPTVAVTLTYPDTSATKVVSVAGYDDTDALTIDESSIVDAPVAAAVSSITVTKQPTKTEYVSGTAFDPTGLEIEVTYDNNQKETVAYSEANKADFSFSGSALTATNVTKADTVMVTYGTKTATTTALTLATVTKVEITTQPTKTAYTSGDATFSLAGMVVKVTYSNGESADVNYDSHPGDFTYDGNDGTILSSNIVQKSGDVSVTYGGQSFNVTISYT